MTRRTFLGASTASAGLLSPVPASAAPSPIDAASIARRHNLTRTQATPGFFEGLLLGNGDIGVCLTVRPDALGIHIGKNDVWDIRVSEEHVAHIKPFAEVLEIWKRAGEEAKRRGQPDMTYLESKIESFREYAELMRSSYSRPWPRPWPCGTVWFHWDSRMVRIVRQELDLASGVASVRLECDNLRGEIRPVVLTCFVSRENGHILVTSDGNSPVVSVAYQAHWESEAKLPEPEVKVHNGGFTAFQLFPAIAPSTGQPDPPRSPDDSNFALSGVLQGQWASQPGEQSARRAFLRSAAQQSLRLDLTLFTPRDTKDNVAHAASEAIRLSSLPVNELQAQSTEAWRKFWLASAVEFEDRELESIWYRNQYFLACCLRPGSIAPGLFGNWSYGKIGTAWHGDYHMNYNTQQVWWGVFSSNHVEQHEPYVRLVESLMPMAEWNARTQFGLPGAYFPHSAYPVPSKANPYPAPPWGYEICETPWTVQSLWRQYQYTLDRRYLERVYPMLRAAAEFVTAFVSKEADGKYHIVPTVSPENWGATVDFRLNKDCIIDLALTQFLLDAVLEASRVLDQDPEKRTRWADVRTNLAPYPKTSGPYGEVWTDVLHAPAEVVYNVPVTVAPVFPAEQVGLSAPQESLDLARRTMRTIRLEGGNDLVWQPLARARLAMLDLDWFKREVRYSMTPMGVCNDRVRQNDGRYSDDTDYDFMMRMGVWTENLSLPAVLNECLLQSHEGILRLFPNTRNLGKVRFRNLRAAGAFLVSAAWDGREVSDLQLLSEKGAGVKLVNPWNGKAVSVVASGGRPVQMRVPEDRILEFSTEASASYVIRPA